MNYFHIDSGFNVTAIADKCPAEANGNPIAWWPKNESGWATRHDFKTIEIAEQIAAATSKFTGRTYIATDAGEGCYPRFDVIEAPSVGDEVSYAFNGDYYPCGTIVSISKSMKLITTSTGRKFYRSRQSGSWLNGGMWSLVSGHISRMNPEF